MAQLTWRNVEAPDFAGVSQSQQLAASLIGNSLKGLSGAVADMQRTRGDAATTDYLNQIARYSNQGDLDAALASGAVTAGSNVNPDAVRYAMERRGALLEDQSRSIANDQTSWNNNRIQGYEAARPAAVNAVNQIRSLYAQGTDEARAKAAQLMQQSSSVLSAAGMDPQDVMSMIDGSLKTTTTGLAVNDAFQQWGDQQVSRANRDEAKTLFASVLQSSNGSEDAARAVRESSANPDVKSLVLDQIKSRGESLFGPGVDPNQFIMDQRIEQQRGGRQGLVDKYEGAGRYDTLFGHSQRSGGAFAGTDVSTMSIGQLDQFANQYGPWVREELARQGQDPRIATPMGKFQIVNSTLQSAAKEMGLSRDTVFTPQVQIAVASHIADKALAGPKTMAGKMDAIRGQWEGFKKASDQELSAAITAYENGDKSALFGDVGGSVGSTANNRVAQAFGDPGSMASDAISRAVQATSDLNSADANQARLDAGVSLANQTSIFNDRLAADNMFGNANLMETLVKRPDRGISRIDAANKVSETLGSKEDYPPSEIAKKIGEIQQTYGLDTDMAAAFLQNATTRTSWGLRWLKGDLAVDNDEARSLIKGFYNKDGQTEAERLSGTVSKLAAVRAQQNSQALLQQAQEAAKSAQQEYFNAQSRAKSNPKIDVEKARLRYEASHAQWQKVLQQAAGNPLNTPNLNSLLGR